MSEITQISERIAKNGLVFQEDGRDLQRLMLLLDDILPKGTPVDRRMTFVQKGLEMLDDVFGWDHKNLSEAQEDQVYAMLVHLHYRPLNNDWIRGRAG